MVDPANEQENAAPVVTEEPRKVKPSVKLTPEMEKFFRTINRDTASGKLKQGSKMILSAHKYIGQVDSKGRAHGYGILKYDNGSMYEGTFLGDKRHGLGIWTQYGGAVIVGEFEKNLSSGRRTIY